MNLGDLREMVLRFITGVLLSLLFWSALLYAPPIVLSGLFATILVIIMLLEWTRLFPRKDNPFYWAVTPLYPVLPFFLLIILNHQPQYRVLLYYLFVIVFSYDTGSYFVGKFIGRTQLSPRISPGKTVEGTLGGIVFAVCGLAILMWELNVVKPLWFIVLLATFVSLLSLFGDLFESWLKRRVRLKDSGSILPGHGGLLDRFDGIMFAVVFFFLFRRTLVWVL